MVADGDPYHQPRRLSVVIHAPVDRVRECLADGGWLSLTVVDPTQGHRAVRYDDSLAVDEAEPTVAATAADD